MESLRDDARVRVQAPSDPLRALHTRLRDPTTPPDEFVRLSDRLAQSLVEFAVADLAYAERTVVTRTGAPFVGRDLARRDDLIGVSILRAGSAMEAALRRVLWPSLPIGKILIQRDDENGCAPVLSYCKLPVRTGPATTVLLCDPMLATGGSACRAVDCLVERGVRPEGIILVSMIAAPEGIVRVRNRHPSVRVVVSMIDDGLNEHKYICPGIGDFGDLYFNSN
ncbi:unnamed protein product (mitochondrion) [Plasmodiophora brassicae]|uniref:uracil phosphoribosyltransferase n=1 Tax=Plasmodiophora brassicae TaxID=37360 RepID=A0A0G4J4F1_PLABS|nr:hypothetical protein PBRA_002381 [Plasmodiophora brassicae]SPQ93694.1 unnamed protein product [Plasmodiophora brassicae]